MGELYDQIDSLSTNIELNRVSIRAVINESLEFQETPEIVIFHTIAKLFDEPCDPATNLFVSDVFVGSFVSRNWSDNGNDVAAAPENADLDLAGTDLRRYVARLLTQTASKVAALDTIHGSNEAAGAWVWIIVDSVLSLGSKDLGLKLFVIEIMHQLVSFSPRNKLIVARTKVSDVLIKSFTGSGETLFPKIFAFFLTIAEAGQVNYHAFLDFYKRIMRANEQVSRKKTANLSSAIPLVVPTLQGLLNNFSLLEKTANFAVLAGNDHCLHPSHFVQFPSGTSAQFPNLRLNENGFTVQMWVKFNINNFDNSDASRDPVPFFSLINAKNEQFWEIALDIEELCLVIKVIDANGFTIYRRFTEYGFDFYDDILENIDDEVSSSDSNANMNRHQSTKYHNIVLIHKFNSDDKSDKFRPSQVYLVIDGQYVQVASVPMNTLATGDREISAKFGNFTASSTVTSVNFSNVLVVNKIQPHQWVLLNYYLGFNYHHNYQDLNLINKFLGYKSLTLFELKSKELKINYDQIAAGTVSNSGDDSGAVEGNYDAMNSSLLNDSIIKSDSTGILNRSFGKAQKKTPKLPTAAFNLNFVLIGDDKILLNFHAQNIVQKGDSNSSRLNVGFSGESQCVLINSVYNSVHNSELNNKYFGSVSVNDQIGLYRSHSSNLPNFFYGVDGTTTILKLIESVNAFTEDEAEIEANTKKLVILLKILFSLISQSHVFAREMEEKGGYHILSIILKNKKKLCSIKVLDTILEFVGYVHNYPIESVIVNSVAYKSLIVDFDIWKDTDKETFKFLLFQFTVFSQDSKYQEYNVNKIVKMKIIKRFIQCLKSNVFTKDFLTSVSNTLLVLIKANPTTEIFHSLSTYIIYSLQVNKNYTSDPHLVLAEDPQLQKKCGICLLELIVHIISNSPSSYIFRKIHKLFTMRWILLLMDDSDEEIVKIALKFLTKMFSISGVQYYTNFISNNGFKILKNLLKKHYNNDEIIVIIFAACFGASQLDNLGTDIYEYCKRLARRNDLLRVSMPEFLYLLFDLIENSIEDNNGDSSASNYDLKSYERFLNCLEFAFKNITCLHLEFKKRQWIHGLCGIIYKLEIQQTTAMNNVLNQFKKLLSRIISSLLCSTESYMLIEQSQSNQVAKKVLTGLIYPMALQDVLKLIETSDSKLRKKTVCKNVCKFLLQNADSTKKFICERQVLANLHRSLLLFIEQYGSRYEAGSSTLKALKRYLGMLSLERMFVLVYAVTEENRKELKELSNSFLYNQELYFSKDVFDSKRLFIFVIFLLQAAKDDSLRDENSNIMNVLRILFMHRQIEFERISYSINSTSPDIVLHFFESLLVSDDKTIIDRLNHDNFFIDSLQKALFICFERFENTFFNIATINDVLRQLPKDSTTLQSEVRLFIDFRTENVNWKSSIISSELAKYYRHFQDQQDNFQFFITNFNKMKLEVSRILKTRAPSGWTVDNIEGLGRVHKRIVPKDDSNFEDQLLYKITVPVATGGRNHSSEQESSLLDNPLLFDDLADDMEALSMEKSKNENLGTPDLDFEEEEDYELIEEGVLFDSSQEDKNRKVLRSLFVGDRIVDLWNVSQLLGLEAEEGILILGETHIYVIENYFHCDDADVVDIDDAPQDARDPYLRLITGQPKSKNLKKIVKTHNTKSWELEKLASVSKRQFLLRDVAIEFFFANGSSFLIICRNSKERDSIHSKLSSKAKNSHIDSDLQVALKSANYTPTTAVAAQNSSSFASKLASAISSNLSGFQSITKKWKSGKISNFYYLMLINTIAGRTFNDLTQYPVFPWVIADYSSKELDFNDPKTFRDFSKPMGSQFPKRARQFQERYDALKSLQDPASPPFHYGTHYSSAMIVTSFLIRLEPYVQSYLLLQGGKFDHADRLFYSIEKAWNSAARDNYADVRELIPEFFYLPEFLVNSSNYDLGQLQNGTTINNVILPPWANNDPKIFIAKQREALESPYVSANLHKWIDLIFGFKQQGIAALESQNVFNHLSYRGAINLDDIDNDLERRSATGIIHNFGQTPLQIFSKPHPPREVVSLPSLEVFRLNDMPLIEKISKLSLDHIEMDYKPTGSNVLWKGRANLFSTEDNLRIQGGSSFSSISVNGRVFEELHAGVLKVLIAIGERSFITGADDGTIHVWKFPIKASKFVTFNSSPILSQLKFQEELEFRETLRGHLSPIHDIKVSRTFNLAVSVDVSGLVLVWDLVRFKFIREINTSSIDGRVKHIGVSDTTGIIGIANDFTVSLFTLNGQFIVSETLKEKITCISFASKKKPVAASFDQVRFEDCHEYWNDGQVMLVGHSRGVGLYMLSIIESKWMLHVLGNFKVRNRDGDVIHDNSLITCAEMNLRAMISPKEKVYGTGEIVAGDSKGRMVSWV